MAYRLAYNTSDSPLLIDDEGHVLGGREWGAVNDKLDQARDAVRAGTLRFVDELGEDADPAATAAMDRVTELNQSDDADPSGTSTTRTRTRSQKES